MNKKILDKTYVYDGEEVLLTGRIGERTIKSRRTDKDEKIMIIYEIRPIEITNESDKTHNKWVYMSDLFVIGDIKK